MSGVWRWSRFWPICFGVFAIVVVIMLVVGVAVFAMLAVRDLGTTPARPMDVYAHEAVVVWLLFHPVPPGRMPGAGLPFVPQAIAGLLNSAIWSSLTAAALSACITWISGARAAATEASPGTS